MQRASASHDGFSLVELLIVVLIIGILAALGVPRLIAARVSANETAAIGSLRAIKSAEAAYSSACGNGGFATSLEDLYAAPEGGEGFISPDLKESETRKSGYTINLDAVADAKDVSDEDHTCNGTSSQTSYLATANPYVRGITGRRHFATDDRGTIFQSGDEMDDIATMESDGHAIQ